MENPLSTSACPWVWLIHKAAFTTTIRLMYFGLPRPSFCVATHDQYSTRQLMQHGLWCFCPFRWYISIRLIQSPFGGPVTESRKFISHTTRGTNAASCFIIWMLSGLLLMERFKHWTLNMNVFRKGSLSWRYLLECFMNWIISLFVCQTHRSAGQLLSWTDSSCALLLSLSSSNFTNLWSSNWRICASSSNRRWTD